MIDCSCRPFAWDPECPTHRRRETPDDDLRAESEPDTETDMVLQRMEQQIVAQPT